MEIPAGADGTVATQDVIITEETAGDLVKIDAESMILNVTKCSAPNKTKLLCII